jgi:Domain of unknown function (DUF222)/HNH endonuclease
MSGQVNSTLEELTHAIDGLDLPVDSAVLAEAFALADRLNAKLLTAVGEHDAAELWRNDGATSMTAWLRHHIRRSGRDAAHCAKTARWLRQLPVTAAAYQNGDLSGGQVQAIVANLKDRTIDLFARHEAQLVPELARLTVRDTAVAMQDWAHRADAMVGDDPEPVMPERSLHLSRILDGRHELAGSFDPEGGAVIATALRLAQTRDVDGEPARSPAHRRADALVDVCRRFLDHQQTRRGGRHRPHLNIITTLDDLQRQRPGRLIDGTSVDHTTVQRLVCDAGIHRVVTDGRSAILDYGTTTRTVPAPLFNALVIRDRHCRYPGCDRPSDWTEAHHVRWITHGGATTPDNLVLLCSRHHHLLHTPGWHAKLLPDNVLEVTDPRGHVHTSHPPGHPPPLPGLSEILWKSMSRDGPPPWGGGRIGSFDEEQG